jgi:hypothetical protein
MGPFTEACRFRPVRTGAERGSGSRTARPGSAVESWRAGPGNVTRARPFFLPKAPLIHRRFIASRFNGCGGDGDVLVGSVLVSHQKAGNLAHQRCEAPVRRVRPAATANSLDTGPRYRDASGFPRVQLGGEGRQPQRRPSRWLGVFRPVARREPAEREDDPRALDPRLDGRRKRRIPGELHLLRVYPRVVSDRSLRCEGCHAASGMSRQRVPAPGGTRSSLRLRTTCK